MRAESAAKATKARPGYGKARWIAGFIATGLAMALTPGPSQAQSPEKKARLPQGLPMLPRVEDRMAAHELSGIAMHGYDPVAYHATGKAVGGSADHEAAVAGLVWRFASAANRAAFIASPETYVPAFEGHDAEGIARGRLVESDPTIFAVIDGRLHLFLNEANRGRYLAEPGLAKKAAEQWPALLRQLGR